MTVAPISDETPAVQIALEARRDKLATDRPDLVDELVAAEHRAAELKSDIAYVDRQLVELDAALAGPPTALGRLTFDDDLPLARYVQNANVPAVVVIDPYAVPFVVFVSDGGHTKAFTPSRGGWQSLTDMAYPVEVVWP